MSDFFYRICHETRAVTAVLIYLFLYYFLLKDLFRKEDFVRIYLSVSNENLNFLLKMSSEKRRKGK